MTFLRTLLAMSIALAIPSAAPSARTAPAFTETVVDFYDGDTFTIAAPWSPYPGLTWKIRVLGIDTPEKGWRAQCPYEARKAEEAAKMTKKLITQSGNQITIRDVKHDKYGGRFDATVVLKDGRLLSDVLIEKGLARPYDGGKKISWCKKY